MLHKSLNEKFRLFVKTIALFSLMGLSVPMNLSEGVQNMDAQEGRESPRLVDGSLSETISMKNDGFRKSIDSENQVGDQTLINNDGAEEMPKKDPETKGVPLKKFVPSEEIGADQVVDFPTDI